MFLNWLGESSMSMAYGVMVYQSMVNWKPGPRNVYESKNEGNGGGKIESEAGSRPAKTVDDILDNTTPGRATKGKTIQYVKMGTYNHAVDDFNLLNPSNVKDINTNYGPGKTGTLPDGRTVTVRPGSTDGRPTVEIRGSNGRGMEIRYGE